MPKTDIFVCLDGFMLCVVEVVYQHLYGLAEQSSSPIIMGNSGLKL